MQQLRSRNRILFGQLPQTVLPTSSKQPTRKKKRATSSKSWLLGALRLRRQGLVFAIFGVSFFLLFIPHLARIISVKRQLDDATSQSSPMNLVFPLLQNAKKFHRPTSITEDVPRSPSFGDVNINLFTNDGMEKLRRIYRDVGAERGVSVDSQYPKSERSFFDYIYNFDDDYLRNPLWTWDDDKVKDEKKCRRNAWRRRNPMDCNSIHELDLQGLFAEGNMKTLGYVIVLSLFYFSNRPPHFIPDRLPFQQRRIS